MPSENDLDFELLFEKVVAFMDSKKEHDRAFKKHDGYSWGYFGNDYIVDMEQKRNEAMQQFRTVLRSEIKLVLQELEEKK